MSLKVVIDVGTGMVLLNDCMQGFAINCRDDNDRLMVRIM